MEIRETLLVMVFVGSPKLLSSPFQVLFRCLLELVVLAQSSSSRPPWKRSLPRTRRSLANGLSVSGDAKPGEAAPLARGFGTHEPRIFDLKN